MRFQVPQFIEVEDKIFGPLTFKQFIYVAGGVGISVVIFLFLPRFLAIIISLPIILFSVALAFYKINGKPFVNAVEAFLKYIMTNKLYIWKKTDNPLPTTNDKKTGTKPIQQVYVPKLSESKLKELTWSLDIKENQNPVTQDSGSLPTTNNSQPTT
ncbi:MAG: PrgI family protein [Candidatus Zambryskibacteria bacterium]|nr:PrgI family protein [Candidatus Zambryskibacteria bacterium]